MNLAQYLKQYNQRLWSLSRRERLVMGDLIISAQRDRTVVLDRTLAARLEREGGLREEEILEALEDLQEKGWLAPLSWTTGWRAKTRLLLPEAVSV